MEQIIVNIDREFLEFTPLAESGLRLLLVSNELPSFSPIKNRVTARVTLSKEGKKLFNQLCVHYRAKPAHVMSAALRSAKMLKLIPARSRVRRAIAGGEPSAVD